MFDKLAVHHAPQHISETTTVAVDLRITLLPFYNLSLNPNFAAIVVTLSVEASPGDVVDEFDTVTLTCQSSSASVSDLEEFVWLRQTSASDPAELVAENNRIEVTFEQDPLPTSILTFTPVQIGDTATYICRSGPTLEASLSLTVRGKQKYTLY